jgi:hypothetical protein
MVGPLVNFDDRSWRAETFQGVFDDFDVFADGRVAQVLVAARLQHLGQNWQGPMAGGAGGHIANKDGGLAGGGGVGRRGWFLRADLGLARWLVDARPGWNGRF